MDHWGAYGDQSVVYFAFLNFLGLLQPVEKQTPRFRYTEFLNSGTKNDKRRAPSVSPLDIRISRYPDVSVRNPWCPLYADFCTCLEYKTVHI